MVGAAGFEAALLIAWTASSWSLFAPGDPDAVLYELASVELRFGEITDAAVIATGYA